MASSNQSNLRFYSRRMVITKSSDMDNECLCRCFICDIMPSDNLKATYSANKIGVKCRNCQTNIVARACSNLYRTCKSCVEFCECHVCITELQWDKKEIIRSSILWSSCIICKHSRICDSCWKEDRETCGIPPPPFRPEYWDIRPRASEVPRNDSHTDAQVHRD